MGGVLRRYLAGIAKKWGLVPKNTVKMGIKWEKTCIFPLFGV